MTQSEFLQKLKEDLKNDLSGALVQDNINYYSNYIVEEVRKGRGEEEVVAELGDPWAIAKTIIDSIESQGGTKDGHTHEAEGRQSASQQSGSRTVRSVGYDSLWKKILLILGIIGVIAIIIAVIGGLFSLVMPFALPILIVVFVLRTIKRR